MRTPDKWIAATFALIAFLFAVLPVRNVTIQEIVQPAVGWAIIGYLLYLGYRYRSPRLGALLLAGLGVVLAVPGAIDLLGYSSRELALERALEGLWIWFAVTVGAAAVCWVFRLVFGWPTSAEGQDMIRAALAGDAETVGYYLESGVDPNSRHRDGRTVLMAAAHEGHLKVVQLLLQRGADVNLRARDGSTALYWAGPQGHDEIAFLLVEHGANPNPRLSLGVSPLHAVVSGNCEKATAALLARGARVTVFSSDGFAPLHGAAYAGAPEALSALLEAGAAVDAPDRNGITAIETATKRGHARAAAILLEKGAATPGNVHLRLLALLASAGETDAVARLLRTVDDPSARAVHQRLALKEALVSGQAHTAESLLTPPLELDSPIDGDPPLIWAVGSGHLEAVRILVDKGADPHRTDRLGVTPLEIAEKQGLGEIADLLRTRGARRESGLGAGQG